MTTVNQVLHIKSDEPADTSRELLLIDAGNGHCCIAKLNLDTKELTELVYYTSDSSNENLLTGIFDKHPEFNQRYSGPVINYSIAESVLFPAAHYKSEDAVLHLQTIYGITGKSNLLSEYLPALNIYNAYRVPQSIHDQVSRKFTDGKNWHKYSVHLKNADPGETDTLLVDFGSDEITVLAFKTGKLVLAQTFQYASPEDVLYFLLKTCREFSLLQQEVKVELSGLIEKDSAIYREMYKYFLHLEFAAIPGGIKLSSSFSEFPPHYFSFICKLAVCAL